jgi:CTP:molybdopterin cytidylyltransferase MocA
VVVLAAGMARRFGGCKPLAPIGPNGEPVIDLLASDAISAGFGHIILVLNPETGPAIRYHVEQCWPAAVEVSFTEQQRPLGTVHAVIAAQDAVGSDRSFAVSNADDVYSEVSMGLLADQLDSGRDEHALIGYRLRSTVATGDPVTRGICEVDDRGYLVALTERRKIVRQDNGETFNSADGIDPVTLDGDLPTSVNLWGFQPDIWEVLQSAMEASGLDGGASSGAAASGGPSAGAEVLLPESVATMVTSGVGLPVRVVNTESKLVGVTHAADLPTVSDELARQVAWGIRPSQLWSDPV